MDRLSEEEITKKAELVARLRAAYAEAQAAAAKHDELIALLKPLYADAIAKLDALEAVRKEARTFVAEARAQMERHVALHAPGWTESAKGERYEAWKDEWEAVESCLEWERFLDPREPEPFEFLDDLGRGIGELAELPPRPE